MKFLVFLSLIGISFAVELSTYKEYLVFAPKNNFKSVSDYALSLGINDFDVQFNEFKIKYNRKYIGDYNEERKFYFLKSIQYIRYHKELLKIGKVFHSVAINKFSDWSPEDYQSFLNYKPLQQNLSENIVHFNNKFYDSLPDSFDWRQQKKVTPIKDQGECGSCWAFATTATIESAYAIKYNKTISLSEQQLMDCNKANDGCDGGDVGIAYNYVKQYGIEFENDYSYVEKVQSCKNSATKSHLKISGWKSLPTPHKSEDMMTAVMKFGPISVAINADGNDFEKYSAGILGDNGNITTNHAVTLIGWTQNYWIIKNSWGDDWGEDGFVRITKKYNARGINQDSAYYTIL